MCLYPFPTLKQVGNHCNDAFQTNMKIFIELVPKRIKLNMHLKCKTLPTNFKQQKRGWANGVRSHAEKPGTFVHSWL